MSAKINTKSHMNLKDMLLRIENEKITKKNLFLFDNILYYKFQYFNPLGCYFHNIRHIGDLISLQPIDLLRIGVRRKGLKEIEKFLDDHHGWSLGYNTTNFWPPTPKHMSALSYYFPIYKSPLADESDIFFDILRNSVILTPKQTKVVKLRCGLDDKVPLTYEAIGKEFSLSRERIRQILGTCTRRLKHPSRFILRSGLCAYTSYLIDTFYDQTDVVLSDGISPKERKQYIDYKINIFFKSKNFEVPVQPVLLSDFILKYPGFKGLNENLVYVLLNGLKIYKKDNKKYIKTTSNFIYKENLSYYKLWYDT